jgi:hypothetical protein
LSYEEWSKAVSDPCPKGHHQIWELKKFAGKLKQICSLLTGIPVEDFEKSYVKDSFLPDNWFKYGIDGDHDFTPDDYGYVSSYEEAVELANTVGEDIKFIQKYRMTVRDLLQQVGTNALRTIVHPNVWVNALFADYKHDIWDPKLNDFTVPDWIITDCRFPNEARVILKYNGLLIRVVRETKSKDSRLCSHCNTEFSNEEMDKNNGLSPCCKNHDHVSTLKPINVHPSETALDNYKFEHVIDNNGTIDDLVVKVKQLLISTKYL